MEGRGAHARGSVSERNEGHTHRDRLKERIESRKDHCNEAALCYDRPCVIFKIRLFNGVEIP